ncbi:MAG: chemotaxis protein CheB [Comamonadaceae bacterium]|nr:chemotaxis protein CheB [Comamonadaceae bacterium]
MRSQNFRPTAAQAASPDAPALFDGRVVAIGASAGGLDALARFFKALPADTGAAYVVIQHLSPDHKSMMADLLGAPHARCRCVVAEQDMPLAGNRVHLIPAGMMMRLAADRLQLAPKPEHGLTLPIDTFFGSLAEAFSERAIAVVLSGTGSDGSRGVQEINAAGGMFFVQDPASAKFAGMPRGGEPCRHVRRHGKSRGTRRAAGGAARPRRAARCRRTRRPSRCRWTRSTSCCWSPAGSTSASTSRRRCCAASSAGCRCCTARRWPATASVWPLRPTSWCCCGASC